jgi:uridine kinase
VLMRDQQRVVAHAVGLGCEPVSPDRAHAAVGDLLDRESQQ